MQRLFTVGDGIRQLRAQSYQRINDPLNWRRLVALVMLGIAWAINRAPDAGTAGTIVQVTGGLVTVQGYAYILVGCAMFILANPASAAYQIAVLPMLGYVALTWSYLKSLAPPSQPWAAFIIYAFASLIAFWMPVRWPSETDNATKHIP